jgi:hypothetical protein
VLYKWLPRNYKSELKKQQKEKFKLGSRDPIRRRLWHCGPSTYMPQDRTVHAVRLCSIQIPVPRVGASRGSPRDENSVAPPSSATEPPEPLCSPRFRPHWYDQFWLLFSNTVCMSLFPLFFYRDGEAFFLFASPAPAPSMLQ